MSNPWDDNFNGSGALAADWVIANDPTNPRRLNGQATWDIPAQGVFTHHCGIMKPLPAVHLGKDFVTKVGYGGAHDTNMGAGMSFGSPINGPGGCTGMWFSSSGPTSYVWVVLSFANYNTFSTNHGSIAATPGVTSGYIRLRTPASEPGLTLFQFSEDGRNFTTVASLMMDFATAPDIYLHAGEGTTIPITPTYDFVRCLPAGAPVLTSPQFFSVL